ncbi:MAG: NRDE family protein [Geothrix sp.]|uniref:NRDE family protein n=1 Tax=Geothrix sp. TaxID=1962974 RepID=UPI00182C2D23|nr:NRDE family protein [Geothrix sp.]NWJ40576.1 NRDE family protein [Geothrix sp.]WIL21419.1 MAG: NRDE family protein [Geothrix sp.]
MCVIAFHWRPEGPLPLLVAGNRDEFYARPTAPMAWWEGRRILAGRDLQAGGTWLGVGPGGRFAALTNHRDPSKTRPDRATRGLLPVWFLEVGHTAGAFLEELRPVAGRYNPFNLLVYDGRDLLGFESRQDRVVSFTPGIHAISNGDFDEPWPKVERLKAGLLDGEGDDEALLTLLQEAEPFPDERLPSTGVALEWERALSPAFIRTPTYGTRASTLLRLGREAVSVLEQRFSPEGPEGRSEFRFQRT